LIAQLKLKALKLKRKDDNTDVKMNIEKSLKSQKNAPLQNDSENIPIRNLLMNAEGGVFKMIK
jgi:hypothetical protein